MFLISNNKLQTVVGSILVSGTITINISVKNQTYFSSSLSDWKQVGFSPVVWTLFITCVRQLTLDCTNDPRSKDLEPFESPLITFAPSHTKFFPLTGLHPIHLGQYRAQTYYLPKYLSQLKFVLISYFQITDFSKNIKTLIFNTCNTCKNIFLDY